MDPLLPESWYSVPYQAIAEFKVKKGEDKVKNKNSGRGGRGE